MEKAQLRWRCRRGMKELDVLLERYLARRYDAAPDAERASFIELLGCEDPQIWGWIMGFEAPPSGLSALVEELQRFR